MALPNYYTPIIQDALNLSGGKQSDLDTWRQKYTSATTPPTYSFANPRPIVRAEQSARDRVNTLNPLEYEYGNFLPYFQQAQERAGVRQQEDLRKYQRDYRALITGNNGNRSPYISGTGDRMKNIVPQSSTQSQASAAYRISDPVTSGFNQISALSF